MRALSSLGLLAFLVMAGCTAEVGAPAAAEAELGGRRCTSSDACAPGQYCSVEDGDCFSCCRPGQPCILACCGVCQRDERVTCGSVTCGAGQVCCNASCGICTEPGGFCTQQACEPTPVL